MKRLTIISLLLCTIAGSVIAGGVHPVAHSKIPKPIQKSVLLNYKAKDVLISTCKKEIGRVDYTLVMSDETIVVYDDKGLLREAKNSKGLKDGLIPPTLLEYVKKSFPNATITEYEYERSKQTVTLNDKIELVFDKRGNFLRLDD